jgi:hypothetical protein
VKSHERYGHETRLERREVECKARNGEKPRVPATRVRQTRDDLPPLASCAVGDEDPREVDHFVCNGRCVGLRRSHSEGESKAMRGWVKVLPTLARGHVREYPEAHPATASA